MCSLLARCPVIVVGRSLELAEETIDWIIIQDNDIVSSSSSSSGDYNDSSESGG
jgi:hypothetical protein